MSQSESLILAQDGLPARATGAWVKDKKYYLARYLHIVTHGVGKQWNGKLAYADLFSGPGRSVIRETGEDVEGSPLIALNYDFARYVFVDAPEVVATLKNRLKNHPKLKSVTTIEGDCNNVIEDVRAAIPANHLTVAFIDPTGLQIHFPTITRLVENRRIDLLMTIQFGMGIRMNIRQYLKSEAAALSRFMGNDSWREDFAGNVSVSVGCQRTLKRYISQLSKLGFGSVEDREIPVRTDQQNLLLYFIVLATRHPVGEKLWRKATDVQPNGQRLLNLWTEESDGS